MISYEPALAIAQKAAQEAADEILQVYHMAAMQVALKEDKSPLTQADLVSHRVITQLLRASFPNIPILSEEGENLSFEERCNWDVYWLIDPLDGTKEFIDRTDEFSVNIALISQHKPVIGVVYVPVHSECYFAIHGQGAFKQIRGKEPNRIHVSNTIATPVRVSLSRRHGAKDKVQCFLKTLGTHELVLCGSTIKICMVAEGKSDLYPRLGPTSEWDTAAGQCILEEAGGYLCDLRGEPLRYNTKPSLRNPDFIAGHHRAWWEQYTG